MENKKTQFAFGEQYIKDNIKDSAKYVLEKFNATKTEDLAEPINIVDKEPINEGSNGFESSRSNVRVRTAGILSANIQKDDYNYNLDSNSSSYNSDYSSGSSYTNTVGSSFVLIIAAVLALIIIVAVVTMGILKVVGR